MKFRIGVRVCRWCARMRIAIGFGESGGKMIENNIIEKIVAILKDPKNKGYRGYNIQFSKLAKNEDKEGREIFKLLEKVTSYNYLEASTSDSNDDHIITEEIEERNDDTESQVPTVYVKESSLDMNAHFSLLKEIDKRIDDAELQSCIADVLWELDNDWEYGLKAVDRYLAAFEEPRKWFLKIDCMERALTIAKELPKTGKRREVEDCIRKSIKEIREFDTTHFTGDLMLLFGDENGRFKRAYFDRAYIDIIEDIVKKSCDYSLIKFYLEIEAEWYGAIKDKNNQKKSLERIAEIAIENAAIYERAETIDGNACAQINNNFNETVQNYKKTGNAEKRNQCAHKIDHYQRMQMGDMKEVVVMTEVPKQFNIDLERKTFAEAIRAIADLDGWYDKEEIADEVLQGSGSGISQAFTTCLNINDYGMKESEQPNLSPEEIEELKNKENASGERVKELEKKKEQCMFSKVREWHECFGAILKTMLSSIRERYDFTEEDLDFLFENNCFVPQDRIGIFRKGIYQGLRGDYMLSSHLLAPQLENSLRELAHFYGNNTLRIADNGCQEEIPLGEVFTLPYFQGVFNQDILFNLRSLLTEKVGKNLRNKIMHGLLADTDFDRPKHVYLWWAALRLCVEEFPGSNTDSSEMEA